MNGSDKRVDRWNSMGFVTSSVVAVTKIKPSMNALTTSPGLHTKTNPMPRRRQRSTGA